MNINWKVRTRNPIFWAQVLGALLLTAMAYNSMEPTTLTSWALLGEVLWGVLTNPYLLFLCVLSMWNAVNDPTTAGARDSTQALTYHEPKKSKPSTVSHNDRGSL